MPTPQAAGHATTAAELIPPGSSELVPAHLGPVDRRLTFASSESIGQLVTALAAAQLEFGVIERNLTAHVESKRTGVKFSYDYADLAGVLRAVRTALAKNGIAILQPPLVGQRSVTITTLLAHGSGEWIRNELTLPLDSTDPQAVGSAITYARRYGLMALLGVAPEDDDDGAGAMPRAQTPGRATGPVTMPTRVERATPPPAASAPAPPATSPAPPQTPAAPAAAASRPPAPGPITITAGDGPHVASNKQSYWRFAFSNGVRGVTFSATDGPKLLRGFERGLRYSEIVTHTKNGHTYIDDFVIDEEGGA